MNDLIQRFIFDKMNIYDRYVIPSNIVDGFKAYNGANKVMKVMNYIFLGAMWLVFLSAVLRIIFVYYCVPLKSSVLIKHGFNILIGTIFVIILKIIKEKII